MNILFGFLFILFMITTTYVGIIIGEERRQNKYIPLIWEKEFWRKDD